MNIESIQATSASQRPAPTEAKLQTSRQDIAAATKAATESKAAQTSQDESSESRQYTVQEAVKHLENFVSLTRADISFSVDEASGVQVVKIMDRESKEVLRQFPSEEAIRIAQALDQLQGVFVKEKV